MKPLTHEPVEPDEPDEPGRAPTLPLLRQPAFRRFWLSRWIAVISGQMMLVALGWQMYDLTRSAWDLGLVGLAQFLPAFALALPAGHLVDRHDRRRVLLAATMVQALVAVLLAWSTQQHQLGRDGILALSVLLGASRAFQMPASQALLPQLVRPHELPQAFALSSGAMQAAIIAGPALGGVVYVAGGAAVYGLSCLGYLVAAIGLVGLRPRPIRLSTDPLSAAVLLAGLRFIVRRPVMLGAMSLDLFAVLLGGATALLPIFVRDILHAGPVELGLLRAGPALGALVMSVALVRWPLQRRAGRWLLGAVAVYGAAMLVFGLSTHLMLSLAALVVSGAADMVSVVIRQTLILLETPDDMRGRVSAVSSVFIGASNQLGEFESGATAAWFGAVGSVVVGGLGTLMVVAMWVRLFPELARRDHLVPQRPAGERPVDQTEPRSR